MTQSMLSRPEQCPQMKGLRRQLYTSTPEGQNLIARRMSEHLRDCDQCAEWWDWVWEEAGVKKESTNEIPARA